MLSCVLNNVFVKYAGPMLPPSPSTPPATPSSALKTPTLPPVGQGPGLKPPTTPPAGLAQPTNPTPNLPQPPQLPPQPAIPTMNLSGQFSSPTPNETLVGMNGQTPATPATTSTTPTTSSPSTPIVTGGSAPQAPAQEQPAAASQTPSAPMDAASFEAMLPKNSNIPPEQQKAFAAGLAESVKGKEGLIASAKAFAAGENSPASQEFQAHMQQFEKKWIQDDMQRRAADDPAGAQTPQGWGGMLQQATSAWQQMPTEMKWITGLGLGGGLLGMASSIFGEGGMGMGLLGLLGIGIGGLAGATGGLFGPDAQKATSDMAYNVGSFFGAVPEAGSMQGKFDMLKDPNAVATLSAAPTLGEKAYAFGYPAEKQEEIRNTLAMLDKAKAFMRVPESMRGDWLQKMDPTLTPEQNKMVAQNLAGLVAQANDPKSPLAQKIQSGRDFAAAEDPSKYVNQQAVNSVVNGATNAWNSASQAVGDTWNWAWGTQPAQSPNSDPRVKANADMTLLKLIEKWAFNDMDAKELSDLKQQNAQGVSYRVEDARRLNELEKRRWADGPAANQSVKKQIAISTCQKAARCWAGYEPVPGKKPYSNNSCRPKGSKKPQKKTKKS